mgnify:CR=1 FL=1
MYENWYLSLHVFLSRTLTSAVHGDDGSTPKHGVSKEYNDTLFVWIIKCNAERGRKEQCTIVGCLHAKMAGLSNLHEFTGLYSSTHGNWKLF